MKQSEFVKYLKKLGATFEERTNHIRVFLNGQMTHLPRHPSKELKSGLVEGIKKQLKIK